MDSSEDFFGSFFAEAFHYYDTEGVDPNLNSSSSNLEESPQPSNLRRMSPSLDVQNVDLDMTPQMDAQLPTPPQIQDPVESPQPPVKSPQPPQAASLPQAALPSQHIDPSTATTPQLIEMIRQKLKTDGMPYEIGNGRATPQQSPRKPSQPQNARQGHIQQQTPQSALQLPQSAFQSPQSAFQSQYIPSFPTQMYNQPHLPADSWKQAQSLGLAAPVSQASPYGSYGFSQQQPMSYMAQQQTFTQTPSPHGFGMSSPSLGWQMQGQQHFTGNVMSQLPSASPQAAMSFGRKQTQQMPRQPQFMQYPSSQLRSSSLYASKSFTPNSSYQMPGPPQSTQNFGSQLLSLGSTPQQSPQLRRQPHPSRMAKSQLPLGKTGRQHGAQAHKKRRYSQLLAGTQDSSSIPQQPTLQSSPPATPPFDPKLFVNMAAQMGSHDMYERQYQLKARKYPRVGHDLDQLGTEINSLDKFYFMLNLEGYIEVARAHNVISWSAEYDSGLEIRFGTGPGESGVLAALTRKPVPIPGVDMTTIKGTTLIGGRIKETQALAVKDLGLVLAACIPRPKRSSPSAGNPSGPSTSQSDGRPSKIRRITKTTAADESRTISPYAMMAYPVGKASNSEHQPTPSASQPTG